VTAPRETSAARKLLAIAVVAVPFGALLLAGVAGSENNALYPLGMVSIFPVLIALCLMLVPGDGLAATHVRGTVMLLGAITGACAGWVLAGDTVVLSILAAVTAGGIVGFLAGAAAGRGRAFEKVELAASGSYFSHPFAVPLDSGARWTHRDYNRLSVFVAVTMLGCAIAVLVFLLTNFFAGNVAEDALPGMLAAGIVLLLLIGGAALFWLTAVTRYRLDARGFSTSGGLGFMRRSIAAADIRRIGVAPTGTALLDDYGDLDDEARGERDRLMATMAATVGGRIYGDAQVGVLLVVESTELDVNGAPAVFGTIIRRTDVPALARAAALLDA